MSGAKAIADGRWAMGADLTIRCPFSTRDFRWSPTSFTSSVRDCRRSSPIRYPLSAIAFES